MNTKSSAGKLQLATYGKGLRVAHMYDKGKSFIGAALLLKERRGNQYVVLHLLCQGLECVLKAILLSLDYEKYAPLLKAKLGHRLVKISEAASAETGLSIKGRLRAELTKLDDLYHHHLLRYGSVIDIMIDPNTVAYDLVTRRCTAMIRVIERGGLLDPKKFRTK